jgi:hypothetical protein
VTWFTGKSTALGASRRARDGDRADEGGEMVESSAAVWRGAERRGEMRFERPIAVRQRTGRD